MDRTIEYIHNKLKTLNIESDFTENIQELFENKVLREGMSLRTAYNTFLLCQSKNKLIFKAILENRHVFDMSFSVEVEYLENLINKKKTEGIFKFPEGSEPALCAELFLKQYFGKRSEYILVEKRNKCYFVGMRFSEKAYDPIVNTEAPPTLLPYCLLKNVFGSLQQIEFKEKIFVVDSKNNAQQAFSELMVHLKSISMMAMISSYDMEFGLSRIYPIYDVAVYVKNVNWPENLEACEYLKGLIYSELHSKSQYAVFLDKEFVAFKYKLFYFKLRVYREKNMKWRIIEELTLRIKKKGENFSRGIRVVKHILGSFGYYPMILDDMLVDCLSLCLCKNVCGDGKFAEQFLSFGFELYGKIADITNGVLRTDESTGRGMLKILGEENAYNLRLPEKEVLDEISYKLKLLKEWKENVFVDEENSKRKCISGLFEFAREEKGNTKCVEKKTGNVCDLNSIKFIEKTLNGFDFALFEKEKEGCLEIDCENRMNEFFLLGTPDLQQTILKRLDKKITAYFSPMGKCLYVKAHEGVDAVLIANLIMSETNFRYIKFK